LLNLSHISLCSNGCLSAVGTCTFDHTSQTWWHSQVGSTPASHAWGPRFKSQPMLQLYWQIFHCFCRIFRAGVGIVCVLRTCTFNSASLVVLHLLTYYHLTGHIVSYWVSC
jgi:hypothetical protein